MADQQGSPQFALSKDDLIKIAKGAGIAALAAVLTYLAEVVFPSLSSTPFGQSITFVVLAALINTARKFLTSTVAIVPFWISMALLVNTAEADSFQLMPQEKYQRLLSYLPKIDPSESPTIEAKLRQGFFYDEETLPPVIQFQPLVGGVGADHTLFFPKNYRFNNIDRTSNPNLEAPWTDPGGLDNVDKSKVTHYSILWLPPKPDGTPWPVVYFRGSLRKSNAVNMPVPTQGWRVIFPANALIAEVHLKKFSDGTWLPFEIRMRLREINDWDVEVYRSIKTADELVEFSGNPNLLSRTGVVRGEKIDRHPNPSFRKVGYVFSIPPIASSKQILQRQFQAVGGTSLTRTRDWFVESMTASDHDNVVPAGYDSAYLGTTREDCRNCHRDVLKHADDFDPSRDWYAYVGHGDGIFRFTGIDPACVRPRGSGPTRLNPPLVQAGIVAMYDKAIHPASVYQVIPEYENPPQTNLPRSNRRIVGGTFR